jgi:hypothetical protein
MARHVSPFEGVETSPAPQPLSKRDLRRNKMAEKLQSMIDTFQANQHSHYRAQLQAVQVDMTLILRADPYSQLGDGSGGGGGVLDDSGEDIRQAVEAVGAQIPNDEAAQKDFHALAGSKYREFVRKVNGSVEQRDADLVALHVGPHANIM